MAVPYQVPRGTRAALNAKASGSTIVPGQIYLITDEARIAVGLTTTTYQDFAKNSVFSTTVNGLVPFPSTVTGKVLADDGTWVTKTDTNTLGPDGDKGDITVGGTGTTLTIDNNAVSFSKFVAAPSTGVVWGSGVGNYSHNASGGGTANFLRADGTWAIPPGSGGIADGDKGDIVVSNTGTVWNIDTNAVTYTKFQQAASMGLLWATATGNYGHLGSAGGTVNYLRADGTWASPPNTLGSDGDKGDITVGGTGTTLTIDDGAVTLAKLANVATNTFRGRVAAGAGVPQDLTPAQARTVLASDSGGGTTNFLRADGTWAAAGGTGGGYTVTTQSAAYTIVATSGKLIVKATAAVDQTITLPTAVGNTAELIIKKTGASGRTIIDANSTETIDGGLTFTMNGQWDSITLYSDNANWLIG